MVQGRGKKSKRVSTQDNFPGAPGTSMPGGPLPQLGFGGQYNLPMGVPTEALPAPMPGSDSAFPAVYQHGGQTDTMD